MRRIIIVGVGALGSHTALLLRNLHMQKLQGEILKLAVIDFDRIEHKNTLAQLHAKSGIGKNKAQSLQQTLSFLFGVQVDAVPHKLTSDNVKVLLKDAALVVDCVDNAPTRRLIQAFGRESKIPCLHGALNAAGDLGRVVWDDKFKADEEGGSGATCEDGENLPFIALVSAHVARAAQEFLKSGRQMSYQLFSRSPSIFL